MSLTQDKTQLRARALGAGHAGDETPPRLDAVWNDLMIGRCQITDSFNTDERWYLVLLERQKPVAKRPTAHKRHLALLEKLLLCGAQKELAIDCEVSPSSIAAAARRGLSILGFPGVPSKAPGLLVMAALAAKHALRHAGERLTSVKEGSFTYHVLSVPRPDRELAAILTKSEFDVVRLLVDGKSHAEIALERGTSGRTVANQLGNAFRRLDISGRSQLLVQLAHRALQKKPIAASA